MVRANYEETIETHNGVTFICITDMNVGNMSVTNDIENVVKQIERDHGIKANDCLVIYCDSEQTWDMWDNKNQDFVSLNGRSKSDAIRICLNNFTKK